MPYVDTVNDIMRLTMAAKYPNGQVQEINLHYQCQVAGTGDTRMALVTYANNGVTPYITPHMASIASFYGSKISTIRSIAKWQPVIAYAPTPGGEATPPLPTMSRLLVSWRTDYAGRAYRGRTYMFTACTGDVAATGKPIALYTGAIQSWAEYMVQPVISGGTTWVPGIFHAKPTGDISAIFTPFRSGTVADAFATQRRGGDYGRPNQDPF